MMKKLSMPACQKTGVKRNTVCVSRCDSRKKYETKISNKVKDNVNKIMVMGAVDFKMMYELLKEADQFHREKVDSFVKNMKVQVPSEEDGVDTEVVEGVVVDETLSSDADENIFVEKN